MDCYSRTIHNIFEKEAHENEDAMMCIPHNNQGLFAICDGAGGAGVFSREWANFLIKSIPKDPDILFENSQNWFKTLSQNFYSSVIEKKDLSDLLLNKKVHRDGSYSTICICWVDEDKKKAIFSSIGDSCCFYFTKPKNERVFQLKYLTSLNEQNSFFDNPKLVNWNDGIHAIMPKHELLIEDNYVVILASDSLAKWILANIYILQSDFINVDNFKQSFLDSFTDIRFLSQLENIRKGHDFEKINDLIQFIYEFSRCDQTFEAFIRDAVEANEIDKDDFTITLVRNEISK
jgi:hypothetical protein